jgi:hypothetical protein
MISSTQGEVLLAAAYFLTGVAGMNLLLPQGGWMAQQFTQRCLGRRQGHR